ncbi:MAG: CRISPR-associated endonuclease Cas2 [Candidatus Sumerlaeota bacterium]|nr:CRISPR-associated endonuclease Cas2 [Candidatus Sumerlaeota bacterium]
MEWSKWRTMWVIVMFDLPTDTKAARKRYAQFRQAMLKDGFMRMQYSVYMRPCPSEENAEVHHKRIQGMLPPEGEVRVLHLTDKQFERMKVYLGKIEKKPEKQMAQLEFL